MVIGTPSVPKTETGLDSETRHNAKLGLDSEPHPGSGPHSESKPHAGSEPLHLPLTSVSGDRRLRQEWTILQDHHRIARLGEGLDATGLICREAVDRALVILEEYRRVCTELGVDVIHAVATSAVRTARNGSEVRHELEEAIHSPIEVISGQNEALLTFRGVSPDSDKPIIVIDIGGGSTEYIAGFSRMVSKAQSLEFGVVRFAERYGLGGLSQPENVRLARELVQSELVHVRNSFQPFPAKDIIAVAGTPTSLATLDLGLTSYSEEEIEGHQLSWESIAFWTERLLGMSALERQQLPGINPNRADILPAGALILDESLKAFGFTHCTVSTRGLRHGVMMGL